MKYFVLMVAMLPMHVLAEGEDSTCFGTTSNGHLEHGVQLPSGGNNFVGYSAVARMAGRTYVHSEVRDIVVSAYEMLAGERRKDMLEEAKALCEHILGNCRDISLCNDVVLLNAIIDLLLENAVAVIEALEDMNNPCRLSIQAEVVMSVCYYK